MSDLTSATIYDRLLDGPLRLLEPTEQKIFQIRLEAYWDDLIRPLSRLYGPRPDFPRQIVRLLTIVAKAYADRSSELRALDLKRQTQPDWFQQSDMIGYVAYTDRFAGNLRGVADKIPYLSELGVTYLHLMPLLQPRPGANDGGYAVLDYRKIRPDLGSMADLRQLATQLRHNGISLCIDLVCNHTAKDHEWAQKARAGDTDYQDYYLMFPDRFLPDQYEQTTPEVFPDWAPGNFTYYPEIDRWVWTTFNEYQWDLNYKNPLILAEMVEIILFLANQGVEVLRLDAVAFMWKRLGTDSQNQPEAHFILQAFRALSRIAAPGLLLKAEAIVSPDKLIPYLGQGAATNKECELAYHNVFMVLLWSSIAEQKAILLTSALQNMPAIPSGTAWCTYVRCHDDIGWAITDEDAGNVGLSATLHRAFLSDFYSGRFPQTFARGATFQFNPKTGDRRISGSAASLAGLEIALEQQDWHQVELGIRRILLLYNLIMAFGGIPLIYMGDELGLLNDHSYLENPDSANDNRWMHRPYMDWKKVGQRHDWQSINGRIYQRLREIISSRKRIMKLHAQASTQAVWTHNEQVFGLLRDSPRGRLLVLANVSPAIQTVSRQRVQALGLNGRLTNCLDNSNLDSWSDIKLDAYEAVWLEVET